MKWIWNLDPVAFSIFGLDIRWYGLVYIFGFFLALYWGWYLWISINPKIKIKKEQFENLIFGTFFFGVLGGRIGEFLFYSPKTFIYDFFEIFKVWNGGMSIHGGILGSIIFIIFWTRKNNIHFLRVTDILVLPLAITLFLGRGANFLNGELVGTLTDQSWGVVFPHVDEYLRHPSQIYEMVKNLLLFGILSFGFQKKLWKKGGFLSGIFLIGYGSFRFFIEFFREPDGWIYFLSTGQVLCILMIVIGGFVTNISFKNLNT